MKKLLGGIIAVTVIAFLIPILLTRKFQTLEVSKNDPVEVPKEEKEYTYPEYGTIRLLHTSTGEIEELPMDEYLYGVVSAELPASYE